VISRQRAKNIGKAYLITLRTNIVYDCRICHNIWESAPWADKLELNNIEERLAILQEHDPDGYRKAIYEIQQI